MIDGQQMPTNLFDLVKEPWKVNPNNSVVAFKDNSSAIRGFKVHPMLPKAPGNPSPLAPKASDWDLLLTAETHNFPCAVAPYPGAEPHVLWNSTYQMAGGIGGARAEGLGDREGGRGWAVSIIIIIIDRKSVV